MMGVNLIPASRLRAAANRARTRTWIAITCVVAAVAFPGAAVLRLSSSLDAGSIEAEIESANAATAAADERLVELRRELAVERRSQLAARLAGEHPDWSLLLRALNQLRSDTVAFETLELALSPAKDGKSVSATGGDERYTLHIRGNAVDLAGVMGFVGKLEALRLFESVTLKQSRAGAVQGTAGAGFEVVCAMAERVAEPAAQPATASADGGTR